jgi:hypothetical protein
MEIFAIIASVFAALVLLDLTAVSAGCDSRDAFHDDHTR